MILGFKLVVIDFLMFIGKIVVIGFNVILVEYGKMLLVYVDF